MTRVFPSRFEKVLRKRGYHNVFEVPYPHEKDVFIGGFEKVKGTPSRLKPDRYTYAVSDTKLAETGCFGGFGEDCSERSIPLNKNATVKEFTKSLTTLREMALVDCIKEEVESVGLKFAFELAEDLPKDEDIAKMTDTVFLIPGSDVTIMDPRTQAKMDVKPGFALISAMTDGPMFFEGEWTLFELRHWLRQLQQGGDECIVCMEQTGACSTQLLAVGCCQCTANMCLPCVVDMILNADNFDVNSGLSHFPCVCCRKPFRYSLLEIAESLEFYTEQKAMFSETKALFIGLMARIERAKKPPNAETMCATPELTEPMKRVLRGEIERKQRGKCDGSGELFESVRKRKSAAKCKRCKRVSYCSMRCRKNHMQEHVVECTAHKKKRRR